MINSFLGVEKCLKFFPSHSGDCVYAREDSVAEEGTINYENKILSF